MKKLLLLLLTVTILGTLSMRVIAGDKPPEEAKAKATECDTDANKYLHGALTNFHSHVCHINVHFPAQGEEFLYKLVVKLGMNPDLTTLAADGSTTALTGGTVDGKAVTGTVQLVVAPDSFATFYDYKAQVSIDAVVFATMYWSGKGSSSKGFLILGGTGFGTEKKLLYVRWDRTTSAQQTDVLGARFTTSYLGSPSTDDAIYGQVTYDNSTKAATVQVVELGRQRGGSPSTSVFACWKMYGTGTAGGAMRVGKTQDSLSSGAGHAATSTSQDGIAEMDDWEGNDTQTEPNGGGNLGPGNPTVQGMTMNYSCDDLNSASGSTKPFNGNAVNHSMTKAQMDAMFAAN